MAENYSRLIARPNYACSYVGVAGGLIFHVRQYNYKSFAWKAEPYLCRADPILAYDLADMNAKLEALPNASQPGKRALRQALAELSDADLSILVLEALEGYDDRVERTRDDRWKEYTAEDRAEINARRDMIANVAKFA